MGIEIEAEESYTLENGDIVRLEWISYPSDEHLGIRAQELRIKYKDLIHSIGVWYAYPRAQYMYDAWKPSNPDSRLFIDGLSTWR